MAAVQRKGDKNSAGGVITRGISSVKVDGLPIAVEGLAVTCHEPGPRDQKHATARTANGISTVKVEGKPVVVTGKPDTCGHPRVGGSKTVNIG